MSSNPRSSLSKVFAVESSSGLGFEFFDAVESQELPESYRPLVDNDFPTARRMLRRSTFEDYNLGLLG